VLGYLRRTRTPLVSLEAAFRFLIDGSDARSGAVAFTIDDGYADHVEIGAPVFAEFDCPVTTFVTTGFVDRALWMWWDRIEYAYAHARRPAPTTQTEFIDACKRVSDAEKHANIASLAATLEVEIPRDAPDQYAPMTWDQMRNAESRGMTFAPHTVTHPVMSRATDAQVVTEVHESWQRLKAEARSPVPIFCYPNGQRGDFGERERRALAAEGLVGAVAGWRGYADARVVRADPQARWVVPRFVGGDDLSAAAQCVTGFAWLRGTRSGEAS
jgi:peptidoglycan/xylan/chitin deacetylase (PgdA/CDA1 family)